jgi:hypothetical protein
MEALRRAIEESELGNWEGLEAQLAASAVRPAATPPHHPLRQLPSPALGLRRLGVATSRASHSGEPSALGPCRAEYSSTEASLAAGASRPSDAYGALAVSLGPAIGGRPHRGRRRR